MENQKELTLLLRLLECLSHSFGSYEQDGYTYRFQDYEQKEIAKAIGADPSSLNRVLNINSQLQAGTYERYITMAENYYAKTRILDKSERGNTNHQKRETQSIIEVRNRNMIKYIVGAMLVTVIGIICFRLSYKEMLSPKADSLEHDYKDRYYVSDREVSNIFKIITASNAPYLALRAIVKNNKVKSGDIDTLEIIRECRMEIESVTRGARGNTLNQKLILSNGESLTDILNRLFPLDSMYRCSDSTLTFAKTLPSHASLFDKGLFQAKLAILDKGIKTEELIERVKDQVATDLEIQIDAILSELQKKQ